MQTTTSHIKWAYAPLCFALLLAACSSTSDQANDNFALDEAAHVFEKKAAEVAYEVDPSMSDFTIEIPAPAVNPQWAHAGGNVSHAPGNVALAKAPVKVWSSDIGEGSSDDAKILAAPIIVEGTIYAQDAHGYVSAYSLSKGSRYWRVDLAPADSDNESMGGGLAWDSGVVFATTGYGQVLALRTTDGKIIWRQDVGSPLRAAPTVSDGRVFVISLENETHVFDAQTGRKIWHHRGIAEDASLLGASSPAVKGDIVVVPYSSGEIFGLRTQNGRLSWSEVLSVSRQVGALPAIADIRGLPVIANKRIYAISYSGRMAAIDQRSGGRIWERDLGGINTPSVVGEAIYVVTNDNKLVALSRQHGKILWSASLEVFDQEDLEDDLDVSWCGPVMAGGRLWVVNSIGVLAAFAPEDGGILYYKKVGDSFYLPPIVANQTMILLDDSGELLAFR